jgi:hypothetical protein
VLQLAIGLEHGAGVDRHRGDHLLDRGQLVPIREDPQPQRLPHLVHQLEVRRDPGVGVDPELDQRRFI